MNQRRIVITGVTRGLGRAMALGFAERGHRVCGCGRAIAELRELAIELGCEHRVDQVDVADDTATSEWASTVIGEFGVPDLLINNAAVINPNAKLWEVPAKEFNRVMSVNVNGTANVLRSFVPAMAAAAKKSPQSGGVIVNFSSGWGRSVSAEVAPYCATKWAIEGLTLALAEELPEGMCAVPLNPGIINTEMLQSCFADGAQSFPRPDEWAERAVPFLLSLGPRHNGQQLSVPE